MNEYGEKIKLLRTKNKDTLRDLGAKLNTDYSNISKIERGERKPSIEFLESICKIYNTPMSYFLGTAEFPPVPDELKEEGVVRISIDKSIKDELTEQDIKDALELIRDLKRDGKIDFNKLNEIQSRK